MKDLPLLAPLEAVSPCHAASPDLLSLTLSEMERDVWIYLGSLFAVGSAERHAMWTETQVWVSGATSTHTRAVKPL